MWYLSRPKWLHQKDLLEGKVPIGEKSAIKFHFKCWHVCATAHEGMGRHAGEKLIVVARSFLQGQ